jgi:hypothetical protein
MKRARRYVFMMSLNHIVYISPQTDNRDAVRRAYSVIGAPNRIRMKWRMMEVKMTIP